MKLIENLTNLDYDKLVELFGIKEDKPNTNETETTQNSSTSSTTQSSSSNTTTTNTFLNNNFNIKLNDQEKVELNEEEGEEEDEEKPSQNLKINYYNPDNVKEYVPRPPPYETTSSLDFIVPQASPDTIMDRETIEKNQKLSKALMAIAYEHQTNDRWEEALEAYNKCIFYTRSILASDRKRSNIRDYAIQLANSAESLVRLDRDEEALVRCKQSVELLEVYWKHQVKANPNLKDRWMNDEMLGIAYSNYGEYLVTQFDDRYEEAEPYIRTAHQILSKMYPLDHPINVDLGMILIRVLNECGRPYEVNQIFELYGNTLTDAIGKTEELQSIQENVNKQLIDQLKDKIKEEYPDLNIQDDLFQDLQKIEDEEDEDGDILNKPRENNYEEEEYQESEIELEEDEDVEIENNLENQDLSYEVVDLKSGEKKSVSSEEKFNFQNIVSGTQENDEDGQIFAYQIEEEGDQIHYEVNPLAMKQRVGEIEEEDVDDGPQYFVSNKYKEMEFPEEELDILINGDSDRLIEEDEDDDTFNNSSSKSVQKKSKALEGEVIEDKRNEFKELDFDDLDDLDEQEKMEALEELEEDEDEEDDDDGDNQRLDILEDELDQKEALLNSQLREEEIKNQNSGMDELELDDSDMPLGKLFNRFDKSFSESAERYAEAVVGRINEREQRVITPHSGITEKVVYEDGKIQTLTDEHGEPVSQGAIKKWGEYYAEEMVDQGEEEEEDILDDYLEKLNEIVNEMTPEETQILDQEYEKLVPRVKKIFKQPNPEKYFTTTLSEYEKDKEQNEKIVQQEIEKLLKEEDDGDYQDNDNNDDDLDNNLLAKFLDSAQKLNFDETQLRKHMGDRDFDRLQARFFNNKDIESFNIDDVEVDQDDYDDDNIEFDNKLLEELGIDINELKEENADADIDNYLKNVTSNEDFHQFFNQLNKK
eukprot:gene3335-4180_t